MNLASPLNDGRGNFFKFSLVSEEITSHSSEKVSKSPQVLRAESSNHDTHLSTPLGIVTRPKAVMNKLPSLGQVVPLATECEKKKSKAEPQNLRLSVSITREIAKEVEIIAPTLVERPVNYFVPDKEEKDKLSSEVLLPSSRNWRRVSKCGSNSPHLIKPVLRKKGFVKSKVKQDSTSASSSSSLFDASGNTDHDPSTSVLDGHMHSCTLNNESKEDLKTSAAALSSTNMRSEVNSSVAETCSRKPGFSLNFDNTTKAVVMKVDERSREKDEFSQSSKSTVGEYSSSTSITASSNTNMSTEVTSSVADTNLRKPGSSLNFGDRTKADKRSRSREKGEFSQSSKSSIGEYSSSTSMSEDSILSGSSRGGGRPHMSNDLRWEAIRCVQKQQGCLGMRHFKLQKQLGCGDIGTVYLAELTGTSCLFALKVMDIEFLMGKKKMSRAQTEREIMQILDHPFLPTLFAHFTTNKLLCLIMEYCPGGDLHVLRQKQPSKFFSEQAARFYVAEVLLALEYLHMLGVVYRDLKPENILVREDGHIMLSDFDLSLRCAVNSWVVKSSSPVEEPPPRKGLIPCSEASCIDPFCLHPSWQVSCFTPRLLSVAAKSRKIKSDLTAQASPTLQLVVEPTSARSNSFVGTHEYLAPEIIKGEGHGSPVDWWTFGIFLFELLYGRTPFKGSGNEETLSNVVSQNLRFPSYPVVSFHARDLIRGLLVKEPNSRLGALKGAAEIKQHPFFEGLNWALIRCAVPPELPRSVDAVTGLQAVSLQTKERTRLEEPKGGEEPVEFEMF